MSTARLTPHARARCAEMGISTKVVKHICRNVSVRYCADPKQGANRFVIYSDDYPAYAVVVDSEEPPLVLTVLFHTPVQYVRAGTTYESKDS